MSLNDIVNKLKVASNIDNYKEITKDFLDKTNEELHQFISDDEDNTVEAIIRGIEFDHEFLLILDRLMDFQNEDPLTWKNHSLSILRKVMTSKLLIDTEDLALKVFKRFEDKVLLSMDSMEEKNAIIAIFTNLKELGVLNDKYADVNELKLMKHFVPHLIGSDKYKPLLKWIFNEEKLGYTNFEAEIAGSISRLAENRVKLLETFEGLKEEVQASSHDYTHCHVLVAVYNYGGNYYPFRLKATFNKDGSSSTDWESLVESSNNQFSVFKKVFGVVDFWAWNEKIVKHNEIEIDDLNVKLHFKDVFFQYLEHKHITSTDDLYIKPDFASDYRVLNLHRNIDPKTITRLKIGGKPYENVLEVIEEIYNLRVNPSYSTVGRMIYLVPKLHWRFDNIASGLNTWFIKLMPDKTHESTDYSLAYMIKDKKGKVIKRGVITNQDVKVENEIPAPPDSDQIICHLDDGQEYVDTLAKKIADIPEDFFRIALLVSNNKLPASEKLTDDEIERLIQFVRHDPLLLTIKDITAITLGPFNPSSAGYRLSALTTLGLRFETFLKQIHSKHRDPDIKASYEALAKGKITLGTILDIPKTMKNIYSNDAWFDPYKKHTSQVRVLTGANTAEEFEDKWDKITKGKTMTTSTIKLKQQLQCLLLTYLCRNINVHGNWYSWIWVAYEPFNITVESILQAYLIAWKRFV